MKLSELALWAVCYLSASLITLWTESQRTLNRIACSILFYCKHSLREDSEQSKSTFRRARFTWKAHASTCRSPWANVTSDVLRSQRIPKLSILSGRSICACANSLCTPINEPNTCYELASELTPSTFLSVSRYAIVQWCSAATCAFYCDLRDRRADDIDDISYCSKLLLAALCRAAGELRTTSPREDAAPHRQLLLPPPPPPLPLVLRSSGLELVQVCCRGPSGRIS